MKWHLCDRGCIINYLGNPGMAVGEEMRGQEETTKKMMTWVNNTCIQPYIILTLFVLNILSIRVSMVQCCEKLYFINFLKWTSKRLVCIWFDYKSHILSISNKPLEFLSVYTSDIFIIMVSWSAAQDSSGSCVHCIITHLSTSSEWCSIDV